MKSCPTCSRNYEDDTLSFCLEDGANLSASFIPLGSHSRNAYPAPTEILPPERIPPFRPDPSSAPTVLTDEHQRTTSHVIRKSTSNVWILVGGMFVGVVVLLIAILGYFAWRANRSTTTEPTQVQTSVPGNAQPQPTVVPTVEATNTSAWLEGVWEGEGYQSDTRTTWKVRLTIHGNEVEVEYPNIPCRGQWKATDRNSNGGSFTEIITKGTRLCANNSRVLVEKVSDSEVSCKYSHANSRSVVATATLTKR